MAVLELLPDRFPGDFVTPFPGLRPATLLDIWLLCKDLRPDDIEHYMAMSFDNQWDFERAAIAFHARPGFKFCLEAEDGRPLAVAGWAEQAPGTFDGWMVSTPETWDDAGKRLTRACRWGIRYMFEVIGARRLQLETLESREMACEWYERGLKMLPERVRYGYGRNGENVACFYKLRGA